MKSYTDLEQSKQLVEILPIESADMSWVSNGLGKPFARTIQIKGDPEELCGCWSLASLLDVLESEIDGEEGETYQLTLEKEGTWWYLWYKEQYDSANPIEVESTEELVDACYEMIIKLHEQKML